jgi:hypothetical protein
MGWIHCTKPAGISPLDFLRKEVFTEHVVTILATAQTPRACYFAFRVPPDFCDMHYRDQFEPADDGSIVTVLIVLYDDLPGGAFNFKPMDEIVGPRDDGNCPASILGLLSPTRPDAPGWAGRWRARQKAWHGLQKAAGEPEATPSS